MPARPSPVGALLPVVPVGVTLTLAGAFRLRGLGFVRPRRAGRIRGGRRGGRRFGVVPLFLRARGRLVLPVRVAVAVAGGRARRGRRWRGGGYGRGGGGRGAGGGRGRGGPRGRLPWGRLRGAPGGGLGARRAAPGGGRGGGLRGL